MEPSVADVWDTLCNDGTGRERKCKRRRRQPKLMNAFADALHLFNSSATAVNFSQCLNSQSWVFLSGWQNRRERWFLFAYTPAQLPFLRSSFVFFCFTFSSLVDCFDLLISLNSETYLFCSHILLNCVYLLETNILAFHPSSLVILLSPCQEEKDAICLLVVVRSASTIVLENTFQKCLSIYLPVYLLSSFVL